MFMPVYGAWIYVQYKWMSLGPFKRVVWSALCFEKSTLDTLQNRDCWTVRVNAETWEMMMIWDVVGFKTYFRSIVFCVKCWRYSWKQVRHGSCPNRIFSQMGEGGNWTSNRECQENLLEEVSRESEVRVQILSCSGNQWWVERETWDSFCFLCGNYGLQIKGFLSLTPHSDLCQPFQSWLKAKGIMCMHEKFLKSSFTECFIWKYIKTKCIFY